MRVFFNFLITALHLLFCVAVPDLLLLALLDLLQPDIDSYVSTAA